MNARDPVAAPPRVSRIRSLVDALDWALDRIRDRGECWERAAEILEASRESTPAQADAAGGQHGQLATVTRQRDGWRDEAETLRRRLRSAESDVDAMRKHQRNEVWFFQGDGYDHLESMATDMVVVIHAADLRDLLAAAKTGARAA